jgi:hypothetical protein
LNIHLGDFPHLEFRHLPSWAGSFIHSLIIAGTATWTSNWVQVGDHTFTPQPIISRFACSIPWCFLLAGLEN